MNGKVGSSLLTWMRKLKKQGRIFLCIMFLAQIAYAATGVDVGDVAPDFSLKNLKGDSVNLKDFSGKKIVILDFWASWCYPCVKAIPELNRIQKNYAEKDVQVLGINLRESHAKVIAFKKRNMAKYPTLLDLKASVANNYRVRGIPNIILIDKDGVVRFNGHSPRGMESILEGLVNK